MKNEDAINDAIDFLSIGYKYPPSDDDSDEYKQGHAVLAGLLNMAKSPQLNQSNSILLEPDRKKALEDVNRWAKHIVRGGKKTVDIMGIEPETLKIIQDVLSQDDSAIYLAISEIRLKTGVGIMPMLSELADAIVLKYTKDLHKVLDVLADMADNLEKDYPKDEFNLIHRADEALDIVRNLQK